VSPTAARYWARQLRGYGVTRVFGLPGTETIELIEAAREEGLDFFLTHHEATAAFAAGMVGQLTRVPGVCIASGGPGSTNLVSGIAAAHLDRRPLLAVIGDHEHAPGLPRHQRLPLELFASIARASARVTAGSLASELPRLVRATVGDPPGPAVLSFPTPEAMKVMPEAEPTRPEPTVRPPAMPDLTPAIKAIAGSRRAMIIVGLGVANASAGTELVRFAERLGCPVADTPQAKGWFPNSHPLFAGTYATHHNESIVALANASDLVIAVGLDSVEFLRPWQIASPVLSLAATGSAEKALPTKLTIEGPLAPMLDALASAAQPYGTHPPGAAAACRVTVLEGLVPASERAGVLWPQTVITELRRALPADGVVTVDVGSHKLLMVLQWTTDLPNTFLNTSGLSSMGTGLPFAIAAKLTWPERPVAAVIGDGGYLMYAGELATLERTGLPIVIVVMNDAALFSIKIKQLRRSYPPVGTEFAGVAVADIARSFGLCAERVTGRAECARAFAAALARDRPTVIDASIDPSGYELSQ
jgi:acetolactate synthase-1/2/3 large subunit